MGNEVLKAMGKRLTAARKACNYSREQLSEIVDLATQTIYHAEKGNKALRPENIINICAALSISTDYLLKGESPELTASLGGRKVNHLTTKQREALSQIIEAYLAAFEE